MQTIKNEIPFARISFLFVIGISVQLYLDLNLWILVLLGLIGILSYILNFKTPIFSSPIYFNLSFCSVILFIGMLSMALHTKPPIESKSETKLNLKLIGLVNDPPKENRSSINAILKCVDKEGKHPPFLVSIVFEKDSLARQLRYGDQLIFSAVLKPIQNKGNPFEFDFKSYMSHKGIYYQTYLNSSDWRLIDRDHGNFLFRLANKTQTYLIKIFKQYGFKDREFAVVSALSLGYTDEIDGETKAAFSASGAMHVLSVSGLHIGVVFFALSNLLSFLKFNKWTMLLKTIIEISFLWLFALLSGMSPAVERAAFMLSFVVMGNAFRLNTSIFNVLLASLFFQLLYNPYLITDVGFQLSYIAMASLLFFFPFINQLLLIKNNWLRSIWSMSAAALAAQIGTLPISLYYFHQFPNLFLLSNVVAILLSTLILYGSGILFFVSASHFLASFFAKILWYATHLLNWFIFWIEDQTYAVSSNISFTSVELILAYISILLFSIYLAYRKPIWITSSLVFLILTFGFRDYKIWSLHKQEKIIVLNVPKSSVICSIDGKTIRILADSALLKNKLRLTNIYKGMMSGYHLNTLNISIIKTPFEWMTIHDKSILIVSEIDKKQLKANNVLNIDFLVASGAGRYTIDNLCQLFHFKTLILDSKLPANQKGRLIAECKLKGIKWHSVAEQGAWIFEF